MRKLGWALLLILTAGCGTSQSGQQKGLTTFAPSSALQHCIGIAPGQAPLAKIGPSPATMQYCKQIPGWDLYDQAGQRFQAGDHAGAAQILMRSAQAGNPVAQLRLALMYDTGDGVKMDKKMAFAWYLRAAQAGEPAAQAEVGSFYEDGAILPENWTAAAEWYMRSAQTGWFKGELDLARAYQFGIGVPQSRPQAIAWYRKIGNQGNGEGTYWANWLSSPTNNIGFRNNQEHNQVIAGHLRFGLSANDPAGITFYNSGQRTAWLQGLKQKVDYDEATVMWNIRSSEYQSCQSTGGSGCQPRGASHSGKGSGETNEVQAGSDPAFSH